MKILLFIFILISTCFNTAFADEVALTFDDLPDQQAHTAAQQREINLSILNALDKYKAPAIGFVNESKLYLSSESKEKIALLKLWVERGYPLGNHTYSHPSMHRVSLDEFQQDVIKGSVITKKLMAEYNLPYTYFRHPYLHTGTTPEARTAFNAFLKQEGYIVAPATIDTDDYVFNTKLIENPQDKDKIIAAYLDHTRKKFAFYKDTSEKIFGRNIKHIWLLHANLLNAYTMDDLLKIAQEHGYEFISLDTALNDPAYASPDNYYKDFGVSWLYRWDYSKNKAVDWKKEPEPG
jgi:peptidoglycan/xylan/chitin deacetylase (PgdA/CDA1 family)